jgi:hypothetical protein
VVVVVAVVAALVGGGGGGGDGGGEHRTGEHACSDEYDEGGDGCTDECSDSTVMSTVMSTVSTVSGGYRDECAPFSLLTALILYAMLVVALARRG